MPESEQLLIRVLCADDLMTDHEARQLLGIGRESRPDRARPDQDNPKIRRPEPAETHKS